MQNNNKSILIYLHDNLHNDFDDICNNIYGDYWITPAALAGIACREYGFLIPGKVNAGQSFEHIIANAIGDSGHGRSLWQIDDRSYPDWIKAHPLSDYRAYIIKCIEVLKEKEHSLINAGFTRDKLGDYDYERAILAAYNCGAGSRLGGGVIKALFRGLDCDYYTFTRDYGKSVMEFRYLYYDMFNTDETPEPTPELLASIQPVLESEPIENGKPDMNGSIGGDIT